MTPPADVDDRPLANVLTGETLTARRVRGWRVRDAAEVFATFPVAPLLR